MLDTPAQSGVNLNENKVEEMEQELQRLQTHIRRAAEKNTPLTIRGSGSKDFYGEPYRAPDAQILDVSAYRGIVLYDPDELMLTVRAGTSLVEIEAVLAEKRQILPFEPPHFGKTATIGGAVSAGLAGPRRAHAGAVRDFVTGCQMIDGRAQLLRFGGRVVKNVAGFDMHKTMVGAMGTLGVLTELSLKVLPAPFAEQTQILACGAEEARRMMNALMGQPLPLSGTFWADGKLFLRLSGTENGVRAAALQIGGETVKTGGMQTLPPHFQTASVFWTAVREQQLPEFALQEGERLWRVTVPDTAPDLGLGGCLMEWGGGLRWYKSRLPAAEIRRAAAEKGGHAVLFRGALQAGETVFPPQESALAAVQTRLKKLFDPQGIFNPKRLSADG
ncbi:MAG: glycolate oxidase subunit GlcE [Neisseria sp.]|nr:glycolate oxidase subunit GlcE [Neisseria sp.]